MHLHERAQESPRVMYIPLMALALASISIAWGWPIWEIESSWLYGQLLQVQPDAVTLSFTAVQEAAHDGHTTVAMIALLSACTGLGIAWYRFGNRPIQPGQIGVQSGVIGQFLDRKWYFDELYQLLIVQPMQGMGRWIARVDKRTDVTDHQIEPSSVDGIGNMLGLGIVWFARKIRLLHNGQLRLYFVAITLLMIWFYWQLTA